MGIAQELQCIVPKGKKIVFICVGTDRSTGDSYGPLVGTRLMQMNGIAPVFGCLKDPVHALNVTETYAHVKQYYPDHFVIAIDSALGKFDNVGELRVHDTPLKPGSGVKRELPEVGDAHISGTVNVAGFMEYFVLQNTRLSLVMDLVEETVTEINSFLESRHSRPAAIASRFGQAVRWANLKLS